MADPFDAAAAKKAGYTDGEIADYLGKQRGFDVAGARKSGYSDTDILAHLSKPKGNTVGGVAGSAAMALTDTAANILGAPVDLVNWATKQGSKLADSIAGPTIKGVVNEQVTGQKPKEPAPFGGSESIKSGIDYAMTLPSRIGDAVSQRSLNPLTDSRTARFTPETGLEKTAYGAAEGVGNALAVALPAGMISRATQGVNALGPRVANVLAQQPVAQAAMGAVGGGVAGATDSPTTGFVASLGVPVVNALARRAITPIQPNLTPQEANIVAAANRELGPGVLTAGKQTGNRTLRALEDTFANSPGASGPMHQALRGEREGFNRAAMARTGQTATDAAPDTIDRAYGVLGQTFDDLVRRTTVVPDVQFARDIMTTAQNYGRRLGTDIRPVFESYIQDLAPLIQAVGTPGANPQISGQVYQNIRSDLARRIRKAGSEPGLEDALNGLATALDDVMERSATSPALRQEWQEARRQYQALKTIDKSMGGGTQADRSAGDIPYGAFKGATKNADSEGYARGRGQFNELSRIGDYLAARTPNSGTPAQQSMMDPWRWPGILIGNRAATLYNTPGIQNYLAHGLGGVQVNPANWRALLSSLAAQEAIPDTAQNRGAAR